LLVDGNARQLIVFEGRATTARKKVAAMDAWSIAARRRNWKSEKREEQG
jgi:hypothetical protein